MHIHAGALRQFVADLFGAADVSPDDAALVADTLVRADLWGHSSHGVLRAAWYLDRLASGAMRGRAKPEPIVDAGAIALWEAHDAIGQVTTRAAMLDAVRRAQTHGVGVVSVRNSNHHGALGYFTRMAAEQGCIGLLTTNGSPAMAPWGGRRKLVGNNPWSIAAPAGRHAPMMLDIANTVVARGKIFLARQKGQPIPDHWAIDGDGRRTTDPVRALEGVILPMAEHKGYAISMMMDVLSGVLSGSGILADVSGPYQAAKRSRCGHLVLALNIAAFGPLEAFNERMERMVAETKAVPLAEGFEEVFYPGEIEARNEARFSIEGITLPEQTAADLQTAATRLGIAKPLAEYASR
ncbi:Ldh family oxidoreductase [Sabulicella rubraurantiaca]|uniref:Ldh family oxidoreductase n=1 Tax=Sabulicella rubraurantiaca TaxID=2811429 RepID=UPI001A979E2E|nr:Ldh family oxidoreductase [Sabulicella rubraurantiaca]